MLTSQRKHKAFKPLLILSKFNHEQATKSSVERRPTVHVRHRNLNVVDTEERKMFALLWDSKKHTHIQTPVKIGQIIPEIRKIIIRRFQGKSVIGTPCGCRAWIGRRRAWRAYGRCCSRQTGRWATVASVWWSTPNRPSTWGLWFYDVPHDPFNKLHREAEAMITVTADMVFIVLLLDCNAPSRANLQIVEIYS